jgi:hypothetical protein
LILWSLELTRNCLADRIPTARRAEVTLAAAFDQPGIFERTFHGPLGLPLLRSV